MARWDAHMSCFCRPFARRFSGSVIRGCTSICAASGSWLHWGGQRSGHRLRPSRCRFAIRCSGARGGAAERACGATRAPPRIGCRGLPLRCRGMDAALLFHGWDPCKLESDGLAQRHLQNRFYFHDASRNFLFAREGNSCHTRRTWRHSGRCRSRSFAQAAHIEFRIMYIMLRPGSQSGR